MKVYTKTGDKGTTALIGGKRVPKSDLRIDCYGTVDELNSWVGLLRDHDEIAGDKFEQLVQIQDRLFTMGSLFATQPSGTKMKLPLLYKEDITFLEEAIDAMNEGLPKIRRFVLPGGQKIISFCHITRTVCRRAERLAVGLNDEGEQYALAVQYLNRLSDYFYMLYRWIAHELKIEEVQWIPKMEEPEK